MSGSGSRKGIDAVRGYMRLKSGAARIAPANL